MVFKGYVIVNEFAGWKSPEPLKPDRHRAGNYHSLPETIEKLAGKGYSGIEVAPFTYGIALDANPRAIEKIVRETKSAGEKYGVPVTGLHWILSFLNLVDPKKEGLSIFSDDLKLTKTKKYYIKLIEHCANLGGKYLVHGSPDSRRLPERVKFDDAVSTAYTFFKGNVGEVHRSVLGYASCNDVKIGFEPLSTIETKFINTVKQGLYLTRQMNSSMFGITIDVKAMAAEGQGREVSDIIKSISGEDRENIVAVHFNDPTLTCPGLGKWKEKEFEAVMAALAGIGWDGYITIEPFVQCGKTPMEDCERSIEFLKRCESNVSGSN